MKQTQAATLTLRHSTATSRERRNRSAARETLLLRALRRIWAACERCRDTAKCGRCGKLDSCVGGFERICIQCAREVHLQVAAERRAEDAGAPLALRALLKELEFCLSGAGRLSELLRAEAVLYTADVLIGWLTPQSLRGPHYIHLDELAVRAHLCRFDDAWGLRAGGTSLTAVYDGWREVQNKQQAYDQLEQADGSSAQRLREQAR